MKRKKLFLAVCLFITIVCLAVSASAESELNALLSPYLAKSELPSIAAAVVKDGKVIASGAVGTRRAGQNIPVTVNDRYHIGSDTKAMTALLVAMEVEQKRLKWSSTVSELFPELAGKMDVAFRGVTVEQLLSHTSGVAPDSDDLRELFERAILESGNLDEVRYDLFKQWCGTPLAAKPGSGFAYANMNYVIAGIIVERLAKKSWEELLVERIYDPLGLKTAGIGNQSSPGRVDAPLAHLVIDGKLKPLLASPTSDAPALIGPAGLAHMSILDFAKWAGWNAGEGKRGPALVSAETLRRLHTPVVSMPVQKDAPPGTPPSGKYAFGWGEVSVPGLPNPLVYHGGSNTMNLAHIWLDPKLDFAMVVTTNVSTKKATEALNEIAGKLYNQYALKK